MISLRFDFIGYLSIYNYWIFLYLVTFKFFEFLKRDVLKD
jgi:hypothetical protein